jgi:hypothetical protein
MDGGSEQLISQVSMLDSEESGNGSKIQATEES